MNYFFNLLLIYRGGGGGGVVWGGGTRKKKKIVVSLRTLRASDSYSSATEGNTNGSLMLRYIIAELRDAEVLM